MKLNIFNFKIKLCCHNLADPVEVLINNISKTSGETYFAVANEGAQYHSM